MTQKVDKNSTYELDVKGDGTCASITLRSVKNRRTRLNVNVTLDDKITISVLCANKEFNTGGKTCEYLLSDLSDGISMNNIRLLPKLKG